MENKQDFNRVFTYDGIYSRSLRSIILFSSVERSKIAANLRLTGHSGQMGGSPNG
jgi:hypothetical protein